MLTLAWLVPLFCHVFAYERQDYTVQARTEAGCAPRGTGRTVEIAPYLYSFRVTLDRFSDDQQWRAEVGHSI
ncbi:uncharacterized protein L969DRAFT_87989 [Mixia osmundae IAM 14324]|uniref:uncharacterized protein n=1 Tax=Mixia osmundae (strain CBS 9802 / IAM 14324 / JCM 22182 / KY 12970) TaxID=764103 RepID=UPI0004A54F06|nr:uncharacterized protein L969DRAFT_87989 [Mixia osmundae IAM 14324]KEI38725.1 hypothetical protein L969DRAFT_87989 [Mixia osmundae IAM 14324]